MAGMFTDPRKGKRPASALDSLSPALWGGGGEEPLQTGPQSPGSVLVPQRRAWRRRNSAISSTMFSSFWMEEMDKNPSAAVCRGSSLEVSAFIQRKDGRWEKALQDGKGPV